MHSTDDEVVVSRLSSQGLQVAGGKWQVFCNLQLAMAVSRQHELIKRVHSKWLILCSDASAGRLICVSEIPVDGAAARVDQPEQPNNTRIVNFVQLSRCLNAGFIVSGTTIYSRLG